MKYVGQAIKRKEDPRLVSGTSSYVDDIALPGMLYMAVARSIHAHARIKRIDISNAQRLSGVHTIVTGDEVKTKCGPIPVAGEIPKMKKPVIHLLAVGKLIYVGQPVAAVLASDKYIARDAADLIEIEYEPLPAVTNPEKALQPGSTIIHEEFSDNQAYT